MVRQPMVTGEHVKSSHQLVARIMIGKYLSGFWKMTSGAFKL